MGKDQSKIQREHFKEMREKRQVLSVYLLSGVIMRGIVVGNSSFTLSLYNEKTRQVALIYKESISVVISGLVNVLPKPSRKIIVSPKTYTEEQTEVLPAKPRKVDVQDKPSASLLTDNKVSSRTTYHPGLR